MDVYMIIEIIGAVAFAVSGAITGMRKHMDLFGVAAMGLTTAVGGGIFRDLILDVVPPAAFTEPIFAVISLAVSVIVFLPAVRRRIESDGILLMLMDSAGLGMFTVAGVRAGMPYHNLFLSVFVGVLTGTGGGVLRDLFAGERPLIFVRRVYATASLAGALLCALLWNRGETVAMTSGAALVLTLRILAARYKWRLPSA